MKESKYKDACDKCGKFTNRYMVVDGLLYCEQCYLNYKKETKQEVKKVDKRKIEVGEE